MPWPDYESSKLGQFFTSDAASAFRAMQVPGTQAAAGMVSSCCWLILQHGVQSSATTGPGHSAGPCKARGCAVCADGIWAASTAKTPEAVKYIFFPNLSLCHLGTRLGPSQGIPFSSHSGMAEVRDQSTEEDQNIKGRINEAMKKWEQRSTALM